MNQDNLYSISCAGIVLFNPDLKTLQAQLHDLKNQVAHIYLVDNTPNLNLSSNFTEDNTVTYIPNEENLGIAKALNQIMEAASRDGYEWVVTLDQDSTLPADSIKNYGAVISEYGNELAVVCPVFFNRSDNRIFGRDGFVQECITSGAFTSVTSWKSVGGYNEWYFIDLVDFEFCARLQDGGFKIYQTDSVQLSHQLGSPKTKKFLVIRFYSPNYSAFRYYYQARNYLVFKHQHYKPLTNPSPRKLVEMILEVDDNKLEKLKAVYRGVRDAKEYIKQHPNKAL